VFRKFESTRDEGQEENGVGSPRRGKINRKENKKRRMSGGEVSIVSGKTGGTDIVTMGIILVPCTRWGKVDQ